MSAERVLAISPRKSGTHLLQQLMVRLGYGIYGEPVPPEAGRAAFSLRERVELAERFAAPAEFADVDVRSDTDEFVRRTDRLLVQLGWVWQVRLAARNLSNLDLLMPDADFTMEMSPLAWTRPFNQTPPRLCWIFHSVDIWKMDQRFLHEWTVEGEPRIVLNIRDPRDALVSMVDFFAGEGGLKFRRFPESAVFGPILQSIPETADRITYALHDPAMPLLADYEAAISLLHHPEVCTVSFEDLVGPRGGGSRDAQVEATRRVVAHVDSGLDPEHLVDTLFDPGSFSFHKGRIGRWREVFTAEHEALFAQRFGHLLKVFGYER
ncbi:hypothetical protein GCM10009853_030590 [Glycomyces scopariae]